MAFDLVARLRLVDNMSGTLNKMNNQFGKLAAAAGIAGGAVGAVAVVGDSVKKAMDFESQLSSIQALTGSTKSEMGQVQALALQMGASTKYSALESAQGIEELLKAGMSLDTVKAGGLEASLNLATAGGLGLADAASIMSDSLNTFKGDAMKASDAANILAGTANASSTDVMELKFGLSAVGTVAAGLNMTFKDTSAALGIFANNGLKGSDAGTSFKSMLSNLQPKTKAQIALFDKLGITTADGANKFFDAAGNIKSLDQMAGLLQGSLKGMTAQQRSMALETMFGSDAIRAGNILFKEGADGVKKFYKEMDKVSALDVAKGKMDNAKGAVEQFQGAIETLQISALLPTMPIIKNIALAAADGAARLTTWLDSTSGQKFKAEIAGAFNTFVSVLKITWAVLQAVGPTLLGVLAGLLAFRQITQLVSAFNVVRVAMQGFFMAGGAIALLTNPIFWIAAAIGFLVAAWTNNWFNIQGVTQSVIGWLMPYLQAAGAFIMSVWNSVSAYFSSIMPYLSTLFTAAWGIISAVVIYNVMTIWNIISTAFSIIWTIISVTARNVWNVIQIAFTAIGGIVKAIMQAMTGDFSGAWETMKATGSALMTQIKKTVTDWANGTKEIGMKFITGIRDGFLSQWENLKAAASSIWDSITGIFKDKTVNIKAQYTVPAGPPVPKPPGHKTGLDRVPYDNYVARLHKDETVLTKKEADTWRTLGYSPGVAAAVANSGSSSAASSGGSTSGAAQTVAASAGTTVHIPKLADTIIVREEADIDRIGDVLLGKILEAGVAGA